MTDPKNAPDEPGTEGQAEPVARKGRASLIIGVSAALLGGLIGLLVIGPKFASSETKPESSEEEADGHQAETEHGRPSGAKIVRIDNVIVNPAGSEGARFLMASVGIEVSPELEARLRDSEVEVRDVVISVLERQTMEMLTRTGARDSVRQELGSALALLFPGTSMRVFLPQFVIQ